MSPAIVSTSPPVPLDTVYRDLLQDLSECYWLADQIASDGGENDNVAGSLNSLKSNQVATLRHCARKAKELLGCLKAIR